MPLAPKERNLRFRSFGDHLINMGPRLWTSGSLTEPWAAINQLTSVARPVLKCERSRKSSDDPRLPTSRRSKRRIPFVMS